MPARERAVNPLRAAVRSGAASSVRSVTLFAIGLLLAPLVAGWAGLRVTHATGNRAVVAWLLGAGLLVFAVWFGGRVDERPFEGLIAGLGAGLCFFGLWRLRRDGRAHA